jgi:poly-gamma-glutamate synthesis protein (capsule biosynthesis protein)
LCRQRNIEGLVFAGVDVVNLANNHTSNFKEDGVWQTKEVLNNNEILTAGINGPTYKKVNGIRFAFLGYNDISVPQSGISDFDEEKAKSEINSAKENSEVVIVAMHWGNEYQDLSSQRQKYLAHFLVDSGADLIIGNHPHWIQPTEIYKDKYIVYALGNFIFDQMWSEKTKLGQIGKFTFCGKNICGVEFFPVKIENYGQPNF